MFVCPVPLHEFYDQYLCAAREAGYQILACLVARAADSPHLVDDIKQNWNSLDDLTDKKILFIFGGDQENRVSDYFRSFV